MAFKELKKEHTKNADYVHRFEREVRILQQLSPHPNIVSVLDKSDEDDIYWYVMPFAVNNLEEFVQKYKDSLTQESRISIFDEILAAIIHSHDQQIIHRDLCPNNVLMFAEDNNSYRVQVADFGLGRDAMSQSARTRQSKSEYGHFYYTAPEQLEGLSNATFLSDIFSLGKILNFVFTNRIPREFINCQFGKVIRKATMIAPQERYANVHEMAKDYEDIKDILMSAGQLSPTERMEAYADGAIEVDWQEFHHFVVEEKYSGHVYYSYLKPITSILGNADSVRSYVSTVSYSTREFTDSYCRQVDLCSHQTGWPFTASDSFGELLFNICSSTEDAATRMTCLKTLWQIAYDQDQWKVQQKVERLFLQGILPAGYEVDVAGMIREKPRYLSEERRQRLANGNVHRIIRAALLS